MHTICTCLLSKTFIGVSLQGTVPLDPVKVNNNKRQIVGRFCHSNTENVLKFNFVSLYVVVDLFFFFLQTPIIKYHNKNFLVFVTVHGYQKCMRTLKNSGDLGRSITNPNSVVRDAVTSRIWGYKLCSEERWCSVGNLEDF